MQSFVFVRATFLGIPFAKKKTQGRSAGSVQTRYSVPSQTAERSPHAIARQAGHSPTQCLCHKEGALAPPQETRTLGAKGKGLWRGLFFSS